MNSNQIVTTTNSTEESGIGIYMTPSLSLSTTNMSTFKATSINHIPSKPSEIKRRSNNRKQISTTLNFNNNNNNNNTLTKTIENETSASTTPAPPPPPPFPTNFDMITNKTEHQNLLTTEIKQNKVESVVTTMTNDFQTQIEQAKNRLKKINIETSSKTIISSNKPNGVNRITHQNTSSNNFYRIFTQL